MREGRRGGRGGEGGETHKKNERPCVLCEPSASASNSKARSICTAASASIVGRAGFWGFWGCRLWGVVGVEGFMPKPSILNHKKFRVSRFWAMGLSQKAKDTAKKPLGGPAMCAGPCWEFSLTLASKDP